MSENLKKFGKFFLLDLLAQGGMAEIYRARHATPTGGGRLLAIKRIQPTYSSNSEFINRFRAETKVTSSFSHPNIVQVYDYGEEQNQLYIAMEYVDGKNLRQFINRLTEMKTILPIEVSCFIAEQSSQALHYAHDYKDRFTGKSLNIIHRDISPQNILVSYDGAVKVIDFGIAKAEAQSESTRAGVIVGKPSYLSPEQVMGQALDGRSDVFALAAVFWELLTGKKLFSAENDLAVIRMVENASTYVKPPSSVNPKIPKELDAILLKALDKDRQKRFQSAAEFQRAIHKFLYQYAPEFNPADLSFYARDLFKSEILSDRKRLHALNERAEQLLSSGEEQEIQDALNQAESAKIASASGPKASEGGHTAQIPRPAGVAEIQLQKGNPEDTRKTSTHSVEPKTLPPAGPNAKVLAGAPRNKVVEMQETRSIPRPDPTRTATRATVQSQMSMTRRAEKESRLSFMKFAAAAALMGAGVYLGVTRSSVLWNRAPASSQASSAIENQGTPSLPQATSANVSVLQPAQVNGASEVSVNESAAPAHPLLVHLKINPSGGNTKIFLDGRQVQVVGGIVPVPLDRAVKVTVESDRYKPWESILSFESSRYGSNQNVEVPVDLVPLEAGTLSVLTTPSGVAFIRGDGFEERVNTPFSSKSLPVGHYKVRLQNELLGLTKEIEVDIEKDRTTRVNVSLTSE